LAAVAGLSRSAEELLRDSTMPIVEIALTVGFQTQAHFDHGLQAPCRLHAMPLAGDQRAHPGPMIPIGWTSKHEWRP